MSWRDCSGFDNAGVECSRYSGCRLRGCPAELSELERLNKAEIKGTTQPLKIGASIPVAILRERFLDVGANHVIEIGRKLFGDGLTDAQIIAIASRKATLRGWTPSLTYHDQPCATCDGKGHFVGDDEYHSTDCLTCGGDGFAPPIERDS